MTPSSSELPAHPTLVAVDLGDGPQVRRLAGDAGSQTLDLKPRVTDTVKVSILDWDDIIDRTALGFDQLKPPGLAEVTALDARGVPIAAADAARNREPHHRIALRPWADHRCRRASSSRPRSTRPSARCSTASPIAAQPCQTEPIALPAGQQELLISPGAAFVVDGVAARRAAGQSTTLGDNDSRTRRAHGPPIAARSMSPPSAASRVLVVPESINPGWIAHTADGSRLTPVTVNGWQQGWVLPPGTAGPVTLTFPSNALYRVGLIGGLALLPVLALLAFPLRRRRAGPMSPRRCGGPGGCPVSAAVLAAGAVISGVTGVVVVGAALGTRYLLRRREKLCDAVTVTTTAGGLILAGAVLSQNPWRSVDGYVGHSGGVQLLALISVGMLAASTVEVLVSAECRN